MTRRQFERKARSLAKKVQQGLVEEMTRLAKTGGIDLTKYANDYQAPRLVLWAALGIARFSWAPLNKFDLGEAKNLEHF